MPVTHTAIQLVQHMMPPPPTNALPGFSHKSFADDHPYPHAYVSDESCLPRHRPQRRRHIHSPYRSAHSPPYPSCSGLYSTPGKQKRARGRSHTQSPHRHFFAPHLAFTTTSSSPSTPSTSLAASSSSSSYPSPLTHPLDYPLSCVADLNLELEDLPAALLHISLDDSLPCQLTRTHTSTHCRSSFEPPIALDTRLEANHRFSASDPSSLHEPLFAATVQDPPPISPQLRTLGASRIAISQAQTQTHYPSPPPTHSNPKRSVPLPTIAAISAQGRQRKRPLRMMPEAHGEVPERHDFTSEPPHDVSPLSPPPTIPTSTLTLPPSPTRTTGRSSECASSSHSEQNGQPQQLLSPVSPQSEWALSPIPLASDDGSVADNSDCDPSDSMFASSAGYPSPALTRPFLPLLEIPDDAASGCDSDLNSADDWASISDRATTPTPVTASSNTEVEEEDDEVLDDKLWDNEDIEERDECDFDSVTGKPSQAGWVVDDDRSIDDDVDASLRSAGFDRNPFAIQSPALDDDHFDHLVASPAMSTHQLPQLDELDLDFAFSEPLTSSPRPASLRVFQELPADDLPSNSTLDLDNEMLLRSPMHRSSRALSTVDDSAPPPRAKRDWEMFSSDDVTHPPPLNFRARGMALRKSTEALRADEETGDILDGIESEESSPVSTSSLLLLDNNGAPVVPERRSPSPEARSTEPDADLDLPALLARTTSFLDDDSGLSTDAQVDPTVLARLEPDILTRVPMPVLARADPDLLRLHSLRARAMAAERAARQKESAALESGNVWVRAEARREKRREKERAREVGALLRLKLGLPGKSAAASTNAILSEPSTSTQQLPQIDEISPPSSTDITPDSTFDGPPLDIPPPLPVPIIGKRKKSKRESELKLGVKGTANTMAGLVARMMFRRRNETLRTMTGRRPSVHDATTMGQGPAGQRLHRSPSRLGISTSALETEGAADEGDAEMAVDCDENGDDLDFLPTFPIYSPPETHLDEMALDFA
ncbi:hypothetical protein HGRIS_013893 [Hohenbuehelia grisea]|uniref:Uncharacterized protein n=1 Tax=Hohenbuehelia grisea TaxID=104357 RepID=A0ABR3IWT5_9AGAR